MENNIAVVRHVGTGTVILTQANAYGGTEINGGGTLQIGNGGIIGTMGSGAVSMSNNSKLVFKRSDAHSVTNAISGAGSVTQAGGDTVTLTGGNSYSGGTFVQSGILQAGNVSNSGLPTNGNVDISSGAKFIFSSLASGINYNGQLTGSGTFQIPNGSRVNSGVQASSGSLTWEVDGILAATGNNAHLAIGALTGASTGSIGEGGANTGRILTIGALNLDTTYNGTIIADLQVVKNGTGTQIFTGNNTYTGATTINGGAIELNGTHTAATGGAYTVNNNGVLRGTGATNGDLSVQSGGAVAPGSTLTPIESLGVGDMTFAANGSFDYQLDSNGLTADLLFGDALDLNNAVLSLSDLGSSFVPLGNKFTLIAYDGPWNLETFSGYADDSTFMLGSNLWLINYNDPIAGSNFQSDATTNGNLFVTITAVPEPSTWTVTLVSMFALVVFAWRQQRARQQAFAQQAVAGGERTA